MSNEQAIKRSYHHGDLAQALIDATVSLLVGKGPAQLSLREVARVAGVSHGAPAHHFGDKAGLLTAVATQGHKRLTDSLLLSQSRKLLAEPRLLAAGEAYIRYAVTEPGYFSVMFQSGLINQEDPNYLAAASESRGVLESCVQEILSSGEISKRRVQATIVALWSQVHGFASLWLDGNFGDPSDMGLLDTLVKDMLASLSPWGELPQPT